MQDNKNHIFFVTLAVVALVADLLAIGQTILTGKFLNFWTFGWFVTIIFIVILLAIGFYLLYIGAEKDIFEVIFLTFGIIYLLLGLTLFLYFGYVQLSKNNSVSDFFAFVTLLTVVCGVGFGCIITQKDKIVFYTSYGFGLAGLIYVLMLGFKYIFQNANFSFLIFSGEILIAIIGGILFFIPYAVAVGKIKRDSKIVKYYNKKINGN